MQRKSRMRTFSIENLNSVKFHCIIHIKNCDREFKVIALSLSIVSDIESFCACYFDNKIFDDMAKPPKTSQLRMEILKDLPNYQENVGFQALISSFHNCKRNCH